MTTYVLYDDRNRVMETYAGPHRLGRLVHLPTGWGIERFLDTTSQGAVTLEDVKRHAAQDQPTEAP